MALHFTPEEFTRRRQATVDELRRRGFAGLLVFRQESMYYLTGYDTSGYVFFQCLFLGVDGQLTLLTRLPDLLQAKYTSIIEDIRIWTDGGSADPLKDLRDVLAEAGCKGESLGVELEAWGLTGLWHERLSQSLSGFCKLTDASDLISRQRAVKSAAELEYVRRAADLADQALEKANCLAVPGAYEGDILAAMQSLYFEADGDYPSMDFIIGRGRNALLCRYFSGRGRLEDNDQLTLEFAASYRHYHALLMRTILTGQVSPRQRDMYAACRDALLACEDLLKPGADLGSVFDAHARVLDAARYRNQRLNACGYGVGATFPPSWVDWPMIHTGKGVCAEPGMTLFLDMFLMDHERGLTMSLSETVLVTDTGAERLSAAPLDLVVN